MSWRNISPLNMLLCGYLNTFSWHYVHWKSVSPVAGFPPPLWGGLSTHWLSEALPTDWLSHLEKMTCSFPGQSPHLAHLPLPDFYDFPQLCHPPSPHVLIWEGNVFLSSWEEFPWNDVFKIIIRNKVFSNQTIAFPYDRKHDSCSRRAQRLFYGKGFYHENI